MAEETTRERLVRLIGEKTAEMRIIAAQHGNPADYDIPEYVILDKQRENLQKQLIALDG